MLETEKQCISCNSIGSGNFCSSCGQKRLTERLSLRTILHEAFHFFTHLDHGFPYTLRRLVNSPGKMQKEYVEGMRSRYQKPFSMFFLCATIAALAIYWINLILLAHFEAGDNKEAIFFHKYWVILQVIMLPFYALVTYLFFKKAGFNYGEIIVFQLYLFSFLFIVLSLIHLFKFIVPHLETRYIELPAIVLYTTFTNVHFFTSIKKPVVIGLTMLSISLCFLFASLLQDFLVKSFF